jgi:fructose-1,6-bisphosphatase/inositol monophosphatase family enzyme
VAGTKSSAIDIVTRADQAAEALVTERLLGPGPTTDAR